MIYIRLIRSLITSPRSCYYGSDNVLESPGFSGSLKRSYERYVFPSVFERQVVRRFVRPFVRGRSRGRGRGRTNMDPPQVNAFRSLIKNHQCLRVYLSQIQVFLSVAGWKLCAYSISSSSYPAYFAKKLMYVVWFVAELTNFDGPCPSATEPKKRKIDDVICGADSKRRKQSSPTPVQIAQAEVRRSVWISYIQFFQIQRFGSRI